MATQVKPPAWRRILAHLDRWGLDLAALGLLVALGLCFLPAVGGTVREGSQPQAPASVEGLPWWATANDLLLVGPDAGAWASAAHAVRRWDTASFDQHRMPTLPLLTAGAMLVEPDVALAGHGLNHLFMLLLPLSIYGLGRAGGGRAVGLAAGALVACCGPLINASRMFGVDALIAFILPTSLLAAVAVRRWWYLAPLAGLVAGLATVTHYTAFPMALPPLLFLVLGGPRPWGKRGLAVALYAAGAAGLVLGLVQVYPFPNVFELQQSVSEGIAPGSGNPADLGFSARAMAILEAGAAGAVPQAISDTLVVISPRFLPWTLASALPWLGALGLGLARSALPPGTPRWRRVLGSVDLPLGLALLATLAPLPLLAAAGAPERYGWNLLPAAALLLVRGLLGVALWADHAVRLAWRRWPLGVLALPLAAAVGWGAWTNGHELRYLLQPSMDGQEVRRLGDLIAAHFPPGGGAVCNLREASAHAGRHYCPNAPCPFGMGERFFRMCLDTIDVECRGAGPVPYVVLEESAFLPHTALDAGGNGPRRPEKAAFDDWLLANYPAVGTLQARQFTATLIALPRRSP